MRIGVFGNRMLIRLFNILFLAFYLGVNFLFLRSLYVLVFGIPLLVSSLIIIISFFSSTLQRPILWAHVVWWGLTSLYVLLVFPDFKSVIFDGTFFLFPYLVSLLSLVFLFWTQPNKLKTPMKILVVVFLMILPVITLTFGRKITYLFTRMNYLKTDLAAQEREGKWSFLTLSTADFELRKWHQGNFSKSIPLAVEKHIWSSSFTADSNGEKIAIIGRHNDNTAAVIIIDGTSGNVLTEYRFSEEGILFGCPKFTANDELVFVRSRYLGDGELIRLKIPSEKSSSHGVQAEQIKIPTMLPRPSMSEGDCPAISKNQSLFAWEILGDEDFEIILGKKDRGNAVQILRRGIPSKEGASLDYIGFPTPGEEHLILLEGGRSVERIEVSTGIKSKILELPGNFFHGHDFSPNGKWFLVEEITGNSCMNKFFAINLDDGRIVRVPIYVPSKYCPAYGYYIRWIFE